MAVVAVVTAVRRTVFAVRVRMIVMRAGSIRVEGERAPEQRRNGSVRAAGPPRKVNPEQRISAQGRKIYFSKYEK